MAGAMAVALGAVTLHGRVVRVGQADHLGLAKSVNQVGNGCVHIKHGGYSD